MGLTVHQVHGKVINLYRKNIPEKSIGMMKQLASFVKQQHVMLLITIPVSEILDHASQYKASF